MTSPPPPFGTGRAKGGRTLDGVNCEGYDAGKDENHRISRSLVRCRPDWGISVEPSSARSHAMTTHKQVMPESMYVILSLHKY